MKLIVYLLLFSVFALICCGRKQNDLTVMTFNIRNDNPADGINRWEARIPLFAGYMDSVAPDIAGMQEVNC